MRRLSNRTAVTGAAVGLGSLGVAALSTLFTMIILTTAGLCVFRAGEKRAANLLRLPRYSTVAVHEVLSECVWRQ